MPKKAKQLTTQMCAGNVDPKIPTYIGTTKPQNFDALVSKPSNGERKLTRQKGTQPSQDEGKRQTKKGQVMATFVKTNSKPINSGKLNRNDKVRQKEEGR